MNRVGLYRFYNFRIGRRGDTFRLCLRHRQSQTVPESCVIELVGYANGQCDDCTAELHPGNPDWYKGMEAPR